VYPSEVDAERGAADLISAGFPSPDISVLLADLRSRRELAGAGTAGASLGGLLCGALGILSGVSGQTIPGMGPIIAAGPLSARLESLGSAAPQGLSGALVGCGIPSENAKSYAGRIQDGGILLAVRCESPDRAKRATQVLHSSGADEVAALEDSPADKAKWALI
jgi:hypothetical protein